VTRRVVGLRVALALSTLIFILCFNFFLLRAAGDPKQDLARNPRLDAAAQQAIIRERGLDKSQLTQFRIYVGDTLSGDLGDSFATRRSVASEIGDALPNTLLLVGVATAIASLLGPLLGIVAGWRRGSKTDSWLTQGSLALYCMPPFWIGMILIALFAVDWPILPTGLKAEPGATYGSWFGEALDVAEHAVLPVTVLALGLLAQYAVVARASVIEVSKEDFVTTAKAIGLHPRRVLRRHVTPNALLPVVTVVGLQFGLVLGGALTVEALFSWPGLGLLTIQAIDAKDYPMLQGIFLVSSAAVIVANLVVDLLYARLDPRVREG
jgi:peptide/nickel transport system permease protein